MVDEDPLVVERATADDADLVLSVLGEAGQWLLSRGIRQWLKPPPATVIVAAIERGEVYVGRAGGVPVGTFTLSWSDDLWQDRPGAAGYLHRLAVRRAFGGKGLGRHLLRHAGQMAAAAGKQFLRLDCWAGNAVLCAYYEQAGFRQCGTAREREYWCCLFEKPIATTGA